LLFERLDKFKIGFFPTNQRKPWGKGSDYCAELCLFLAIDSPHENRARKKKHFKKERNQRFNS